MNKRKNWKTVLIIVVVLLTIGLTILFVFFRPEKKNEYPTQPITQKSLGSNEGSSLNLKGIESHPVGDYKLLGISDKVFVDDISNMITDIDRDIVLTEEVDGEYYYWSDGKDSYFQYSLLNNTLHFNVDKGIPWTEVELTGNSFSLLTKKYFDKTWQYKISKKWTLGSSISTFYYANHLTSDELPIETSQLYGETDFLELENGNIKSGRLLLLDFFDTGIKVPLLNLEELSEYINVNEYPKSIFFNPSKIAEVLSIEEEYLNDEILELQQEAKDCRAIRDEVVYLYNSFDQSMLTPVFKLALECTLVYQEKEYFVPAIAYVNAIQPDYVTVQ